jgi:imidazoleglycerol-phosphate dehydratase
VPEATEGRIATVSRGTSETAVEVTVSLDGGDVEVSTGVPFFDHMLDQLGRHSNIGMAIKTSGDLEVDAHHTVEDTGIALGEALARALGDKKGVRRYGDALVPMEESLALVALDLSGRPFLDYEADLPRESVGQYDVELTEEFLQALCRSAGITMHVSLRKCRNAHHGVEAIYKAVARSLGDAVAVDPRAGGGVPSTKGVL